MRIQMQYNSYNSNSCGNFSWGEVEDYTVNFGGSAKRIAPTPTVNLYGANPVLQLFPNPARTDLTVRIPLQQVEQAAPWFIIDATGKVVLEGETSVETLRSGLSINLRNLSAGMYYFSLNSTEVRTTKRFIVQP